MPRVEIITGDAPSPTLDLCIECVRGLVEGEPVPQSLRDDIEPFLDEDLPVGARVGSTDVEHPPYETDPKSCDRCQEQLTGNDN